MKNFYKKFEEWVVESNNLVLEVGDSLICKKDFIMSDGSTIGFKKGKKYTIKDSFYNHKNEPWYSFKSEVSTDHTMGMEHIRNCFELPNDYEESSYEEWIEESNNQEFEVGDKAIVTKIIDDDPSEKKKYEKRYLGKIGDITALFYNSTFSYAVKIDGEEVSFKKGEIEPYDELEEQDYEEWNEE